MVLSRRLSYRFQTHPKLTAIKIYQAIQSPGVDLLLLIASKREIDSEDDFRSGCRNVGHHCRQQSFSGLHSPVRSNLYYYMRYESLIIPKLVKCKLWIECLVSLDFRFILIIKLIKRFTFAVRIAR